MEAVDPMVSVDLCRGWRLKSSMWVSYQADVTQPQLSLWTSGLRELPWLVVLPACCHTFMPKK